MKKKDMKICYSKIKLFTGKQDFFNYGREIPVKPEVVTKFKETAKERVLLKRKKMEGETL